MKNPSCNTMIGDRRLAPETLMLGYGYDPSLSEGSVKPPVFLTSTFAFRSAEEGRDFFDVVAGRRAAPDDGAGLVYSRFNHPNAEIVEDRLAICEAGEAALAFSSGMAAITTAILATARPGDVILHSQPLMAAPRRCLPVPSPASASRHAVLPTAPTWPPSGRPPKPPEAAAASA